MRASIIIPAWNQWPYTRRCLDAIERTVDESVEVIVVDNGSTDRTPTKLSERDVRVVSMGENRGFAAACNAGAAVASAETLVFLNNDTIPLPDWLRWLEDALQGRDVVAAGPITNNISGPQCRRPTWPRWRRGVERLDPRLAARAMRWNHAIGESSIERVEVDRLVAFCLAIERAAFEAVGGWDEAFGPGTYEDDALCLLLRRRGWRLVFEPRSRVYHVGQVTFRAYNLDDVMVTNRAIFTDRYGVQPGPDPRPFIERRE